MTNNKYFDREKQAIALKWLEEKWTRKRECDVCGNDHWQLADELISPLSFTGKDITIGGNSYPCVLLICNHCGNSKTFNAVIMKIEGDDNV